MHCADNEMNIWHSLTLRVGDVRATVLVPDDFLSMPSPPPFDCLSPDTLMEQLDSPSSGIGSSSDPPSPAIQEEVFTSQPSPPAGKCLH